MQNYSDYVKQQTRSILRAATRTTPLSKYEIKRLSKEQKRAANFAKRLSREAQ